MTLKEVYNGKEVNEVVELLHKYGSRAKVISGGTDVVIALRNEKISPEVLIDISKIDELKKIEDRGDHIVIGGGVTFTQIVESDLFLGNLLGLHKACKMVGSPQIRNMGTIGGNIANGSAAADSVPPLIALDAVVSLLSQNGVRKIGLEAYYHDPIKENELLTEVSFAKPKENEVLTFSKLGLRKALAISRLTLSSFVEFEGGKVKSVRVASGALAKFPMREVEVENYLTGKVLDEESVEVAIEKLKDSMDIRLKGRSTLPYKRVAISTILREALEEAMKFGEEVRA
ncbi:MAG: xanthine dehydrogenase family protein subunit M [Tissierellaceae bacterium]|nr:xanthine dehydrogenase family protein subunit M [Tissierellaceae bacterium]